MRNSMTPTRAFASLLPAAAVVLTLGVAGPAMAEGDAGSWQYESYVAQEKAKAQATNQAASQSYNARKQKATIGVGEGGGIDTYSGMVNSPYYITNSPQSRGGADR